MSFLSPKTPSVPQPTPPPSRDSTADAAEAERRRTIRERCERVAELVGTNDQALVWCHMNAEGDTLVIRTRKGEERAHVDRLLNSIHSIREDLEA